MAITEPTPTALGDYSPERHIRYLQLESSRATVYATTHAVRQHRVLELIRDYRYEVEPTLKTYAALVEGIERMLKGES